MMNISKNPYDNKLRQINEQQRNQQQGKTAYFNSTYHRGSSNILNNGNKPYYKNQIEMFSVYTTSASKVKQTPKRPSSREKPQYSSQNNPQTLKSSQINERHQRVNSQNQIHDKLNSVRNTYSRRSYQRQQSLIKQNPPETSKFTTEITQNSNQQLSSQILHTEYQQQALKPFPELKRINNVIVNNSIKQRNSFYSNQSNLDNSTNLQKKDMNFSQTPTQIYQNQKKTFYGTKNSFNSAPYRKQTYQDQGSRERLQQRKQIIQQQLKQHKRQYSKFNPQNKLISEKENCFYDKCLSIEHPSNITQFNNNDSIQKSKNTIPDDRPVTVGATGIEILNKIETKLKKKEIKAKPPIVQLNQEEINTFGNRCPEGYKKFHLLGKGGCACVWKGKCLESNQDVALKQINRINVQNFQQEINFIKAFNNLENIDTQQSQENLKTEQSDQSENHQQQQQQQQQLQQQEQQQQEQKPLKIKKFTPKQQYQNHEGFKGILQCLEYRIQKQDLWLGYSMGGEPISKNVYNIKGEFFKGERLYKVNYTENYYKLFNQNLLKQFIKQCASTLDLFQKENIVHCDLKPENILVKMTEDQQSYQEIKIIDYGSSFSLKDKANIQMTTPEYMPPEILLFFQNFSRDVNNTLSQTEYYRKIGNPWSIDVWSLGIILIELITGIPQWLCYRCRVLEPETQTSKIYSGLFAVKGQDPQKMVMKQKKFVENPSIYIRQALNNFPSLEEADQFYDLICKMLQIEPKDRISPQQILNHPFLNCIQ